MTQRATETGRLVFERARQTEMGRQMDRQTDRQTDRQAGRQTDRQTDRHMQSTHWVNDVAKSLKDEDWSDQVTLLELVEGLHTHAHELLFLLLCSRGEVLQQREQQLLCLVDSLGTLDHQPGNMGEEGGKGGGREEGGGGGGGGGGGREGRGEGNDCANGVNVYST